jgi:putative transposase
MTNTGQPHKKRTYSTFTKYCCQKEILSKEIKKNIPRSTRHSWRKQSVSSMEDCILAKFESESLDYANVFSENEKTKSVSAALEEIILLYQKIIGTGDAKKQLMAQSKRLILETIDKLRDVINMRKLCEYLSISTHQYHSWKNNRDCKASLLKLCRKKFPTQLTGESVKVIKTYMDNVEFQFLSRATVYWKIIREGAAMFSKGAFYKYCRLLGYHKRPVINKSKRNAAGIKATATAEILHTDITYIITADDRTSYLSFVEDNFSKCILSGKASKTPTSAFVKNNIEEVAKKYNLYKPVTTLITDNGSENKGELDAWLKTEVRTIKKVIARIDIPQANNVVEALHKKFKNEFLQGKKFANHEALVTALPNLIAAYNNQYHDSLYGYSPSEVWNGAIPDKNQYRPLLADANEYRKQANKQFNCCTNIRTY